MLFSRFSLITNAMTIAQWPDWKQEFRPFGGEPKKATTPDKIIKEISSDLKILFNKNVNMISIMNLVNDGEVERAALLTKKDYGEYQEPIDF